MEKDYTNLFTSGGGKLRRPGKRDLTTQEKSKCPKIPTFLGTIYCMSETSNLCLLNHKRYLPAQINDNYDILIEWLRIQFKRCYQLSVCLSLSLSLSPSSFLPLLLPSCF